MLTIGILVGCMMLAALLSRASAARHEGGGAFDPSVVVSCDGELDDRGRVRLRAVTYGGLVLLTIDPLYANHLSDVLKSAAIKALGKSGGGVFVPVEGPRIDPPLHVQGGAPDRVDH